jgi:hypothetical protein
MKTIRRLGPITAAAGLAIGLVGTGASPVAAECSYIPPLPKISFAIPTAKELFTGTVISIGQNGDGDRYIFGVRVEEVFRGPEKVGSVHEMVGVAPNWPTELDALGSVEVSCAVIGTRHVGEKVAIALGARFPGGMVHSKAYDKDFYQPPTIFNTMAILDGSSREQYGSGGRQLFSIERLRELARQFPPATDTLTASAPVSPPRTEPCAELAILAAAGLLGAASAWRRTRRTL